jgi:DNA-binding NarL/FixJ family response regulator
MSNLSEIIKERSEPGIVIFDREGRLLYSNRQALEMLATMRTEEGPNASALEELYSLCAPVKDGTRTSDGKQANGPGSTVLSTAAGICYSLRSLLIDGRRRGDRESHILVLIEKVIEKHMVDMEKAQREFSLSRREVEVVSLICKGFTNREISEKIFISEYTVKVHVRNIMKKMNTGSRNAIFALL